MRYTVIITRDIYGNVFATAPGLPDCHVQAKTRQEVLHKIRATVADVISRSEIVQLEVPVEPKSGEVQQTPPWEFFGAHPDNPAWGKFFEDLEQQRASDSHS